VKNGWQFYEQVWQPATRVVSQMESHGLLLDPDLCRARAEDCVTEQQRIGEQLNTWAGREINWGSPKQKAEFFYDTRGWPVPPICGNTRAVKRVQPGKRPTDEMAVLHLARTLPNEQDREHLRLLQGYPDVKAREHELSWAKIKTTKQFYEQLPKHAEVTGRVHTQLGALARTGRLTSKNPNLQNQPPSVRDVFRAGPGLVFLDYDFSGLEWRILAHIVAKRYDDTSLADEIRDGRDPHQSTADEMTQKLGQPVSRAAAKILNYRSIYGGASKGLAVQLGISDEQAEELTTAFELARPGVARWFQDAKEYVRTHGHCRTLLGRFLPLPEIRGNRWDRLAAERQALNYPIQGSAADIVSMAMIKTSELYNDRLREMGVRLVLQIHDELLFEVPEGAVEAAGEEIKKQMEGCLEGFDFRAPLAVEGGSGLTWGDC
jgi:DNA polymerase-1